MDIKHYQEKIMRYAQELCEQEHPRMDTQEINNRLDGIERCAKRIYELLEEQEEEVEVKICYIQITNPENKDEFMTMTKQWQSYEHGQIGKVERDTLVRAIYDAQGDAILFFETEQEAEDAMAEYEEKKPYKHILEVVML